jgi:erythromycin esterase-like protein
MERSFNLLECTLCQGHREALPDQAGVDRSSVPGILSDMTAMARILLIAWFAGALGCARSNPTPARPARAASPVAQWLSAHAIPLATLEPGSGFADLSAVGALIGDAKVVGLGEANHGAHELFRLRHRLVELLVAREGFNVFALEADYAPCEEMNDYVLHGRGDPASILASVIGLIPWDTEEVLLLIRWIRRWNEDPAHTRKVRFYGFDAQGPVVALRHVRAYLQDVDPGADAALARLAPIASFPAWQAYAGVGAAAQHDVQAALAELLERFDRFRDVWSARSGAERWTRERQALRTAQQAEVVRRDDHARDRFMADNVRWLLAQEPDARLAAWAHNGHLSSDPGAMGNFLKAELGPKYVNIATAFDHGAFRARRKDAAPDEGWRAFLVGPAPSGSLEAELAAVGRSWFLVDLRAASGDLAAWLDAPRPFRTAIGTLFDDRTAGNGFIDVAPRQQGDVIAYVAETTVARPNPWSWQNAPGAASASAPRNLDWSEGATGGPPPAWTVTGGADNVRVEAATDTRRVVLQPGPTPVTVQQGFQVDPSAKQIVVRIAAVDPAGWAWLWLRGERSGGALTLRKIAPLLPGPDGGVRIEAAVPPGTATLHIGITSLADQPVHVGAVRVEHAGP